MSDLEQQSPQIGSVYVNSNGTSGANVKIPIVGNDKNVISAIGAVGLNENNKLASTTAGLALDNVAGHGISLTQTNIPDFGKQLTGAGHLNLLHNDNHDVNANAFVTRNMTTISQVPDFNTVGVSLDYMYKNQVGASVGAAHTPFLKRTDYFANGNLNLLRDQNKSLDFSAGISKTVTPFVRSSCEPKVMLSFRKFF